MKIPDKILRLAEIVNENGGRAMLVGGCVRDELMNVEPKDWDVEIYNSAKSMPSAKPLRFTKSGRIWMSLCRAASEKRHADTKVSSSKAIPKCRLKKLRSAEILRSTRF